MQVEYSDVVVSPSAYMLGWVQEHGWRLPANVFVQQNILSSAIIRTREELAKRQRAPSGRRGTEGAAGAREKARKGHPGGLARVRGLADSRDGDAEPAAGPLSGAEPSSSMPSSDADRRIVKATELVFFARLEILKGIYVFCDALDLLVGAVNAKTLPPFNVTFLGNPNLPGVDAVKWLSDRHRSSHWPWETNIITDRLQPAAVAYMRERPGRISVLASLVENSPYTVLESIALEIPFVASNVGGIPGGCAPRHAAATG
jgi:glycosyltransferase involved in cell wall biosynthesis